MKKMTNGKDVKFVADALVTAYRNRGYYVEGEEVTPPPPADPEGQAASGGQIDPEGQDATEDQEDPEEPETAEPPADPEGQSGNQFICPICGKSYAKKAYLDKHMAEKHNQD